MLFEALTIDELINRFHRDGDDINEWVYANRKDWESKPAQCLFYLVYEDAVDEMPDDAVYNSIDGPLLPLELKPFALRTLMFSGDLLGVIENASIPANPNAEEVQRFIHAINYYREMDTFYDFP